MTNGPDVGATRLGTSTGTYRSPGAEGEDRHEDRHEETFVREEVRQTPVNVNVAPARQRGDQVRWGPVWAGLIVALATFLLLELAFFALGWLTLNQGAPGTTAGWVTGLIGLFAFFLGGMTAGATAMWRGLNTGLLHGILVWALGVVAFLFLTLFGGGALFGSLGSVAAQVVNLQQAVNLPNVQAQQVIDTARDGASWAVLGLGLSILASALGGIVGAKMWPRDQKNQTVDVNR